jgi:hypothetical protein
MWSGAIASGLEEISSASVTAGRRYTFKHHPGIALPFLKQRLGIDQIDERARPRPDHRRPLVRKSLSVRFVRTNEMRGSEDHRQEHRYAPESMIWIDMRVMIHQLMNRTNRMDQPYNSGPSTRYRYRFGQVLDDVIDSIHQLPSDLALDVD